MHAGTGQRMGRCRRIAPGCRAAGVRPAHRRRHRPGDRRARGPFARTRSARAGTTRGAADRHARRAGHRDAQHHQGHPRFAGAGGRFRVPAGCAGGQRRHLHPLCQRMSRRWRRPPTWARQRRSPSACPYPGLAGSRRAAPRARRRRPSRATDALDREARQRRHGLHPQPRPAARPRRRLGRAGGTRVRQPACERCAVAQGHRSHRRRLERPAAPARRPRAGTGTFPRRQREAGHGAGGCRDAGPRLAGSPACGDQRAEPGADAADDRRLRSAVRVHESRLRGARRDRRRVRCCWHCGGCRCCPSTTPAWP